MTPAQQDEVLHDPAYALLQIEQALNLVSDAFLTAPAPSDEVDRLAAAASRLWAIAKHALSVQVLS